MATTSSPAEAQIGQRETARRPELDALRLLVVFGLFFFHSALIFHPTDDYYLKNDRTSEVVTFLTAIAVVWAMPLLFLVAGMGARFSLRHRSAGAFAKERVKRLLVPLVFGTIVLMPIPVWFRLRIDPSYTQSYLSFWADFLRVRFVPGEFPFVVQGAQPQELFETGQLWFLVLLFTFSLLFLPLLLWLRGDAGSRAIDRLGQLAERRGVILLAALPIAIVGAALDLEEGFAAWNRWEYAFFFLYGFIAVTDGRFAAAMRRDAPIAAVVGVLTWFGAFGLYAVADGAGQDPLTAYSPASIGFRAVMAISGWAWLVAIMGYVGRRVPERHGPSAGGRPGLAARLGPWANEATLPLYVVHQPVIVAIGFVVIRWSIPAFGKYLAISLGSLAVACAIYQLLIRAYRPTRFLFGMKPLAKPTG